MISETAKQRKLLEQEATALAAKHGHRLSGFATCYGDRVKAYSEAYCLNGNGDCPVVAIVNVKAPQGKQIGGLAVVFNCEAQGNTSNEQS